MQQTSHNFKNEKDNSIKVDDKVLVDDCVRFIENYEGEGLLITGSLYFISEVKAKVTF